MNNSLNEFDKKIEEYFSKGRRKAVSVQPQKDFTLLITFDNSEERIFDVKPILEEGGVFTFLNNYEDFKRVYIDDTNSIAWNVDPNIDSNIIWNNKIDISTDTCYLESVPINKN